MDQKPTTRCKFHCFEVSKVEGWNCKGSWAQIQEKAKLSPVSGGSPENESFFASTPCGSIEVGTVAEGVFVIGKDYFVDFTEIPAK